MKIVVGLGNPGRQYAATRHNVGWMVVDRLADRAGWGGRRERDAARVVWGRYRDLDLALVKPLTFMNESGLAVRKVLAREHAPLEDLLVVVRRLRPALRPAPPARGRQCRRPQRPALDHRRAGQPGLRPPARGHRRAGAGAIDHVLSRFAASERADLPAGHRRRRGRGRGLGARRRRPGRQPVERVARSPRRRADEDAPPVAARRPEAAGRPTASAARRPAGGGSCRATGGPRRASPARDRRVDAPARSQRPRPAPGGSVRVGRPPSGAGRRPAAPAAALGGPRRPDRPARRQRHAPGAGRPLRATRAARDAKVGTALRHVTYAGMPHGAKTYLAAALARATGERLLWIARDAEIADRVVEELEAWFGDPAAVVTLEPRSALAYERSDLIGDESAARVAALAAWAGGAPRVLVASVQALFQRTLAPDDLPTDRCACAVRPARLPGPRSWPSSCGWATSRWPRSAAAASSCGAAASSTSSRPGAAAGARGVVRRRDRVAARLRPGRPARRGAGRRT